MNRELHRKLDRVIEQAIEHFGAYKQIEKAKEEFSELLLALQKYTQRTTNDPGILIGKVREELADVQIMLAQLICIFDADEVTKHIDVKTCRLDLMMLEQKEERRSQERYSDIKKANEELNQAKMRSYGNVDCGSRDRSDEASQGCCIPEDMKLQNGRPREMRATAKEMFGDNI